MRCTGHEVVPSGADTRFVKREWARYEAMLGAIGDPASLEAAVAKRAHKRLAEIAAEVKLSNSGVVELANQVWVLIMLPHDRFLAPDVVRKACVLELSESAPNMLLGDEDTSWGFLELLQTGYREL